MQTPHLGRSHDERQNPRKAPCPHRDHTARYRERRDRRDHRCRFLERNRTSIHRLVGGIARLGCLVEFHVAFFIHAYLDAVDVGRRAREYVVWREYS